MNSSEIEYVAILSLVIGCYNTLKQTDIKRFLAYSSIVHVGFLLSGDLISSFIYLFSYLLASFAFFAVILSLKLNGLELTYLSDFKKLNTAHRTLLVFALASMAGLPPFAGFYGKMLV